MEKISLIVVLLSPLLELQQSFKVSKIKIIFCWIIISFICALISQHNVSSEHKPLSITIFQWIVFQIFTIMHEIWIGIENDQIMIVFVYTIACKPLVSIFFN
jgi:hypothetical protein